MVQKKKSKTKQAGGIHSPQGASWGARQAVFAYPVLPVLPGLPEAGTAHYLSTSCILLLF
jgi:hypothetical protein